MPAVLSSAEKVAPSIWRPSEKMQPPYFRKRGAPVPAVLNSRTPRSFTSPVVFISTNIKNLILFFFWP